jgi:hypothetical protein
VTERVSAKCLIMRNGSAPFTEGIHAIADVIAGDGSNEVIDPCVVPVAEAASLSIYSLAPPPEHIPRSSALWTLGARRWSTTVRLSEGFVSVRCFGSVTYVLCEVRMILN